MCERQCKVCQKRTYYQIWAKCRRYMMAYNAYDNNKDPLTFKVIERFVKMAKTHRNIADQDKAFVEKAWREAQSELSEI